MVEVWKMNSRQDNDAERTRLDYFISKSAVGPGWGFKDEEPNSKELNTLPKYKKYFIKIETEKSTQKKWNRNAPHFIFEKIHPGDYIWVFNHNKNSWFLGKVGSNAHFIWDIEANKDIEAQPQLRDISWKEIGKDSKLHGHISAKRGQGTFARYVRDKEVVLEVTKYLYDHNSLTGLKISTNNFLSYIGYDGMEDLLFFWLHDQYGYQIVPSTNKKNTKKYEFEMRQKANKKIVLQVKNGGGIDLIAEKYLGLLDHFNEIWLFTRDGNIMVKDKLISSFGKYFVRLYGTKYNYNFEKFLTNNLVEFAKDPKNRWLLPEQISMWVEKINIS